MVCSKVLGLTLLAVLIFSNFTSSPTLSSSPLTVVPSELLLPVLSSASVVVIPMAS